MSRRYRWYLDDPSLMVLANHPDWAYGKGHVLLTVTRCPACSSYPLDDEHRCYMPSQADQDFLERVVNAARAT